MRKRFLEAALLMILVVGMVASTVLSISTEDTEQCLPTAQAKVKAKEMERTDRLESLGMQQNNNYLFAAIENKAQYKVFLRHLVDSKDTVTSLMVYVMEEGCDIYLDDLVGENNIDFLTIKFFVQNKAVRVKEPEKLKLKKMEWVEIISATDLEAEAITSFSDIKNLLIELEEDCAADEQVAKVVEADNYGELKLNWYSERGNENYGIPENLEEVLKKKGDWEGIKELNPEQETLHYMGVTEIYGFDIRNYKFYKMYEEELSKGVIIVTDEETRGKNFKQVLILPEATSVYADAINHEMQMEDMNFDGYMDLIYNGTDSSLEFYHAIVYLWNPEKKQFEHNANFPQFVKRMNRKKKRFEVVCGVGEKYQIYKYIGRELVETKSLLHNYLVEPQFPEPKGVEKYYEYGELKKELKVWEKGDLLKYELYEDKILKESGYAKGYDGLDIIRYREYPEFDFYWTID